MAARGVRFDPKWMQIENTDWYRAIIRGAVIEAMNPDPPRAMGDRTDVDYAGRGSQLIAKVWVDSLTHRMRGPPYGVVFKNGDWCFTIKHPKSGETEDFDYVSASEVPDWVFPLIQREDPSYDCRQNPWLETEIEGGEPLEPGDTLYGELDYVLECASEDELLAHPKE